MISVQIYQEPDCFLDQKAIQAIKQRINQVLKEKQFPLTEKSSVSVALVGRKTMADLVKRYYPQDQKEHPVLSFSAREMKEPFVFPPDQENYLGEIVVSFDFASDQAQKEKKSSTEIILSLVEHACLHLVGIHHQ